MFSTKRALQMLLLFINAPITSAQITFQPAQTFPTNSSCPGPFAFAHGDFNRDGRIDLAVACYGGDNVLFFRNNTVGSIVAFELAQTVSSQILPRGLAASDFDLDGDLDVVVARSTAAETARAEVDYLRNDSMPNGQIAFSLVTVVTLPVAAVNQFGTSIATGDFNLNGFMDFVVTEDRISDAGHVNGRAHIFYGNGVGGFSLHISLLVRKTPVSVAVGRFDGGNVPDVAVSCEGSDTIVVYLGLGPGAFMLATLPNGNLMRTDCSGQDIPSNVRAVRVNEDAFDDLLCANGGSETGYLFRGREDGFFDDLGCINMNGGDVFDGLTTGDFDSDGRIDFAVSQEATNSVGVLRQAVTEVFAAPVSFAVGSGPAGLDTFDVNGDGCLDLVAANFAGSSISVLLNNTACP